MLEYQGQYGHAKVMIDNIESSTVQQIYEFLNHEAFTNPIAIMPDTHTGAGAVIGFTMEMTDKVIPNVIGVDIGCGMLSERFRGDLLDGFTLEELDKRIREMVPFGTNVHTKVNRDRGKLPAFGFDFWDEVNKGLKTLSVKWYQRTRETWDTPVVDQHWLADLCEKVGMDYERALLSAATLGGGNHFIEVGKDENNLVWITIHSGSRQIGQKIAIYHQRKAKKLGRTGPLGWLDGEDLYKYLIDMVFAQTFASMNRYLMAWLIHHIHGKDPLERIETVHNFIDFNDFIMRKGAISSYKGEKMVIPFNMLDGLLICEGKSKPEWNYSAPHGAGRLGSRRWAKDTLSKRDAEKEMKDRGIYFSKLPIDECAGAYKDPKIIEETIEPTARIINRVKPILSMKD
jgi:RNA-splicing ligase RtcB